MNNVWDIYALIVVITVKMLIKSAIISSKLVAVVVRVRATWRLSWWISYLCITAWPFELMSYGFFQCDRAIVYLILKMGLKFAVAAPPSQHFTGLSHHQRGVALLSFSQVSAWSLASSQQRLIAYGMALQIVSALKRMPCSPCILLWFIFRECSQFTEAFMPHCLLLRPKCDECKISCFVIAFCCF